MDRDIIISPVGEIPPAVLKQVRKSVARAFFLPAWIKPLLQSIEFAYSPERGQYHSTAVLEKLSRIMPQQSCRVLAITDKDLYIPILTHVYGEAQLNGNSCIISIYRLDSTDCNCIDEPPFLSRTVKEALHELGHTWGLRHCSDTSCLMHYCRKITDVDRKETLFCRYCRTWLNDALERHRIYYNQMKPMN